MRAERCPHKPERVLMGDRRQVLADEWPGAGMAEHGPVAAGLPVTKAPSDRQEVQPPAVRVGDELDAGAVGTRK